MMIHVKFSGGARFDDIYSVPRFPIASFRVVHKLVEGVLDVQRK